MLQVYQHWNPLQSCVVGACWPPEFFSYIQNSKLRQTFEKIAIETEEDLGALSKFLTNRGVNVLRPNVGRWQEIRENLSRNNIKEYPLPPVTPRDYHIMIGDQFYYKSNWDRVVYADHFEEWPAWKEFYNDIRQSDWPDCDSESQFESLPRHIQDICMNCGYLKFRNQEWYTTESKPTNPLGVFDDMYAWIKSQGNTLHDISQYGVINGSMVTRVGVDLYLSTEWYGGFTPELDQAGKILTANTDFRANIIDCGGHSDGTFCPVVPGLIVSYHDQTTYEKSFPGWEVVYGSDRSVLETVASYHELRKWGYGRYYMPDQENSPVLTEFVDTYMKHWTGNAIETKFFVNILMVDEHTAITSQYDENVVRAMERYGVTCHVLPMRHQFFWDAGTHCHTLDLDRQGEIKDYFPDRECALNPSSE
jgi:hypothetical protein